MDKDYLDMLVQASVRSLRSEGTINSDFKPYLSCDMEQFVLLMSKVEEEATLLTSMKTSNVRKRRRKRKRQEGVGLRQRVFFWDLHMVNEHGWYKPFHALLMLATSPFRKNKTKKKRLTVGSILKMPDSEFIDSAYRLILHRPVEASAMKAALKALHSEGTTRITYLWSLKHSTEGKQVNAKVPGLSWRYYLHRAWRILFSIPVLGYVLRILYAIIRLPKYLHALAQSNLHIYQLMEDMESIRYQSNQQSEQEEENKKLLDQFYDNYNSVIFADNDRELIKGRYSIYLNYIARLLPNLNREKATIVDLGSGRGEWLELLIFAGGYTKAVGIDSNSVVVKNANAMGLTTLEHDAVAYLKGMRPSSADVITSFHMVEHLETMQLLHFFNDAYSALKPGGLLIAETPNPENILVSTNSFYLDVTHQHPIPPDLLSYMAKNAGFDVKEILRKEPLNYTQFDPTDKSPLQDLIYRFNIEQNYAILAVKP